MERATVRELRRMFFDNDYYAVLLTEELTNKEVRKELYSMEDQNKEYNYSVEDGCILIWEVEPKEVV